MNFRIHQEIKSFNAQIAQLHGASPADRELCSHPIEPWVNEINQNLPFARLQLDAFVRNGVPAAMHLQALLDHGTLPPDGAALAGCVDLLASDGDNRALTSLLFHCPSPDADTFNRCVATLLRHACTDALAKVLHAAPFRHLLLKDLDSIAIGRLGDATQVTPPFASITLSGARNTHPEALFAALGKLQCDRLYLSMAQRNGLTPDAAVREIAPIVGASTKAPQFHLRLEKGYTTLMSDNVKLFAESVARNGSLVRLDLGLIGISAESLAALAKALGSNATLVHVDVSRAFIGKVAKDEIIAMLASNRTLKHLALWAKFLDAPFRQALAEALRNNQVLLCLDEAIPTVAQDASATPKDELARLLLRNRKRRWLLCDPHLAKYLNAAAAAFLTQAGEMSGAAENAFPQDLARHMILDYFDLQATARLATVSKAINTAARKDIPSDFVPAQELRL